jgi:hypothetical protein
MNARLHRQKSIFSPTVFLAAAALLGALILYDVAGYFSTTAQTELAAAQFVRPGQAESGRSADAATPAKSVAETLKGKNLFVLPAPKQNPVREVAGILGDEALIGGKWYSAGDRVEDAEILAVEPTLVRVSWNGQQQDFSPIVGDNRSNDAAGSAPSGGRGARAAGRGGLTPEERQRLRQQMRGRLGSGG